MMTIEFGGNALPTGNKKRISPHSSLGFVSPEQFRLVGERSCGKADHTVTLENSSSFPLSHSLDGGKNSPV